MAKLVFDIETSALPLEQFDEAQQEYLFRECEKIADEPARAARHAEIQQQFNLWPFTAQVVCIAMLNADTSRGQVLFTAADYEEGGGRSRAGGVRGVRGRGGAADGVLGCGEALRDDRHVQRARVRRAVHLSALGAAERADHPQGLAGLPLPRSRTATWRSSSPSTT